MAEAFFIAKEKTMQQNRKNDRQTREIISEARQRARERRDWHTADILEIIEAITENRRPRHNARRLVSFLEA